MSSEKTDPRTLLTPLNLATTVAFLVGVLWRWLHVAVFHDPRSYVDSDMRMYVELAKRFARPGFVPSIGDVTHPPATGMLFSWFYQRDASFQQLIDFQLLVTCLVPIAVAGFALAIFDRRAAKWALIVASVYYPFIDYGGYFLAEVYMMLLNPLAAAAFVAAAKQRTAARGVLVGFVAGGIFFLAMSFKMVALPAMVIFSGLYWLFSTDATRKMKTIAVVMLFLGAAPGTAMLSRRCTKANDGQFCLVSNKGPADFLLGHYGRIQGLSWKDSKGRIIVTFGSPSAYQRGYREVPSVPFLITDGPKNSAAAWGWIRQHPAEAFVLSCEHVYDLFCGSLPWPSVANGFWVAAEGFHFIFLLFLLFPSLARCLDVIRQDGFRAFLKSREMLVLSLAFGVMVAVFVATGEPRYRQPYDSVFILLAVQFCMHFKLPRFAGEAAPAVAPERSVLDPAFDEEPGAPKEAAPEGASEEADEAPAKEPAPA